MLTQQVRYMCVMTVCVCHEDIKSHVRRHERRQIEWKNPEWIFFLVPKIRPEAIHHLHVLCRHANVCVEAFYDVLAVSPRRLQ